MLSAKPLSQTAEHVGIQADLQHILDTALVAIKEKDDHEHRVGVLLAKQADDQRQLSRVTQQRDVLEEKVGTLSKDYCALQEACRDKHDGASDEARLREELAAANSLAYSLRNDVGTFKRRAEMLDLECKNHRARAGYLADLRDQQAREIKSLRTANTTKGSSDQSDVDYYKDAAVGLSADNKRLVQELADERARNSTVPPALTEATDDEAAAEAEPMDVDGDGDNHALELGAAEASDGDNHALGAAEASDGSNDALEFDE